MSVSLICSRVVHNLAEWCSGPTGALENCDRPVQEVDFLSGSGRSLFPLLAATPLPKPSALFPATSPAIFARQHTPPWHALPPLGDASAGPVLRHGRAGPLRARLLASGAAELPGGLATSDVNKASDCQTVAERNGWARFNFSASARDQVRRQDARETGTKMLIIFSPLQCLHAIFVLDKRAATLR